MKNVFAKNIMVLLEEVENSWTADLKNLSPEDKQDYLDAHLVKFMHIFENEFKKMNKKDQQKNLKAVFDTVANHWEEKSLSLSAKSSANLPSYLVMIAMGDEIVPFVLGRMQEKQQNWFKLLTVLTGKYPISKEDVGDMGKMTQSWLTWGKNEQVIEVKETKKQLRLF